MAPRVLYLCPCTLAASAEDRERAAKAGSASASKDKQHQHAESSSSSSGSATAGPSKGRRSLAPSSASTSTPFQPTDSDPPHQSSSQPNTSTSAQNQDLLLTAVPLPPSLDPSSSYAHHALDSLYFCEECDQLKCARCTAPEVSAYYCPVCLFDVQAAGVKADRNRCSRSCFLCPSCTHTLQVVATDPSSLSLSSSISTSSSGTSSSLLRGDHLLTAAASVGQPPFLLHCPCCRWDSAEVGLRFDKPTGLSMQLQQMQVQQQQRALSQHAIGADGAQLQLPLGSSGQGGSASAGIGTGIGIGMGSGTGENRSLETQELDKLIDHFDAYLKTQSAQLALQLQLQSSHQHASSSTSAGAAGSGPASGSRQKASAAALSAAARSSKLLRDVPLLHSHAAHARYVLGSSSSHSHSSSSASGGARGRYGGGPPVLLSEELAPYRPVMDYNSGAALIPASSPSPSASASSAVETEGEASGSTSTSTSTSAQQQPQLVRAPGRDGLGVAGRAADFRHRFQYFNGDLTRTPTLRQKQQLHLTSGGDEYSAASSSGAGAGGGAGPTAVRTRDLYPLRAPLRAKMTRRCRLCAHILVRPDTKAQGSGAGSAAGSGTGMMGSGGGAFRIKLVALDYLPRIELAREGFLLSAASPSAAESEEQEWSNSGTAASRLGVGRALGKRASMMSLYSTSTSTSASASSAHTSAASRQRAYGGGAGAGSGSSSRFAVSGSASGSGGGGGGGPPVDAEQLQAGGTYRFECTFVNPLEDPMGIKIMIAKPPTPVSTTAAVGGATGTEQKQQQEGGWTVTASAHEFEVGATSLLSLGDDEELLSGGSGGGGAGSGELDGDDVEDDLDEYDDEDDEHGRLGAARARRRARAAAAAAAGTVLRRKGNQTTIALDAVLGAACARGEEIEVAMRVTFRYQSSLSTGGAGASASASAGAGADGAGKQEGERSFTFWTAVRLGRCIGATAPPPGTGREGLPGSSSGGSSALQTLQASSS